MPRRPVRARRVNRRSRRSQSSSSSLPLHVGRRVKVLFGKDQWYEGTTKTNNKVVFDDGDTATLNAKDQFKYYGFQKSKEGTTFKTKKKQSKKKAKKVAKKISNKIPQKKAKKKAEKTNQHNEKKTDRKRRRNRSVEEMQLDNLIGNTTKRRRVATVRPGYVKLN